MRPRAASASSFPWVSSTIVRFMPRTASGARPATVAASSSAFAASASAATRWSRNPTASSASASKVSASRNIRRVACDPSRSMARLSPAGS
jgi:hypothetical protein